MDGRSLIGVPRLHLAHHLTMKHPEVPGGWKDQILDLMPNCLCLFRGLTVVDGQSAALVFQHDTPSRSRKLSKRAPQMFESIGFPQNVKVPSRIPPLEPVQAGSLSGAKSRSRFSIVRPLMSATAPRR
jgi:hypothetical protein